MINLVIADKFQNTKDFLISYLKKSEDIKILKIYDELNSIVELKEKIKAGHLNLSGVKRYYNLNRQNYIVKTI